GVIFLLHCFEDVVVRQISFSEFIKNEQPKNYVISIVITFFVSVTIYAFQFYKAYQDNKIKQQQVIAGTANAKFESLKNQIDPHFLFNSLNVLSSLIEENPDNAQKFTISLSKIYRYVLEQKDKELVTVAEELAFAKTYMNLLKMRFENSITFEIPENFNNDEAKVVPLSLQLLLENTIKHNIVSEQKPLHIKIFINQNNLVVQNDLQKKEVLGDRKGVGLQNIINRYAILTQREVAVVQANNQFSVYLPILTKQINIMETVPNYSESTAYNKAKQQVEKLKGFYGHLTSYCLVIPTLLLINLTTDSRYLWFFWPMAGWGFGLIFHALSIFGLTSNWEERKIQEMMNKNKEQKSSWN
ncbi:MAG: 2TM domain-containing protein, partial [Flavobacterium sp.]|nr:2TM domain-containing protein [Flavobacterium sp.]